MRSASWPLAASPTISDALLLEQASQAGAEEVVVVDEQHAEGVLLVLLFGAGDFRHDDPPRRAGRREV